MDAGKQFDINWRAPFTISVAFIGGVATAIGHHLFYKSLDRTEVGATLFDQQYNNGIGTALAFLTRSFLVLAVGIAYWQVFWQILHNSRLKIENIDTLHGLLGNIFNFVEVKTLYRCPTLVILALLSWTLPFAAIVTPGALSVGYLLVPSATTERVGVPFFSIDSMASTNLHQILQKGEPAENLYDGPIQILSRMSVGIAIRGSVPSLTGFSLNSTYDTKFDAPAVHCQTTSEASLLDFLSRMNGDTDGQAEHDDDYGWHTMGKDDGPTFFKYGYVSWTPTPTALVPWDIDSINRTKRITFSDNPKGLNETSSSLGQYKDTPPTVFIASKKGGYDGSDWNVLNCSFYEATYNVNFNWTNGISRASVLSVDITDSPLKVSALINSTSRDPNGISPPLYENVLTPRQVGYQAFIESFCRVLVGTAAQLVEKQWSTGGAMSSPSVNFRYTGTIDSTKIFDSVLAATEELAPISNTSSALALGPSIEELFTNATLALFSEPRFTSEVNVSQTEVHHERMVTAYYYTRSRLLWAYGTAILCTFAAVLFGWITILRNTAAYSNKFSTIMRTTRGHDIDAVVAKHDERSGADPLPKDIAVAKLDVCSTMSTNATSKSENVSHESIAMLGPKYTAYPPNGLI